MNYEDLSEKFAFLALFQNALVRYSLYIINNGATYKLCRSLPQFDIFIEIQEAVDNYLEENEYDEDYKIIEPSKIEAYGIILAEHENFKLAKNRMKRLNLLSEIIS
jgi:hypothetical protein